MQINNSTKTTTVQVAENFVIGGRKIVKYIRQGKKFMDVVYLERKPKQSIRKISKSEYVVLSTGEIKNFEVTENKRLEGLRKTFYKLKTLIRANFGEDSTSQLFVTLTYAENMRDKEKLMDDFENFWKKLKRKLPDHKLEYIAVAEPQERGAWHFHVMIKSMNQAVLYIDNVIMAKLWKHGYTTTERLKSDDVGNYYIAYFTDLQVIKLENNREEHDSSKISKAYEKGSRLHFYPKNFKFYRTSQGIIKPDIGYVDYETIKNEYGTPVEEVAFKIIGNDGEVVNIIKKESFKRHIEKGKADIGIASKFKEIGTIIEGYMVDNDRKMESMATEINMFR